MAKVKAFPLNYDKKIGKKFSGYLLEDDKGRSKRACYKGEALLQGNQPLLGDSVSIAATTFQVLLLRKIEKGCGISLPIKTCFMYFSHFLWWYPSRSVSCRSALMKVQRT